VRPHSCERLVKNRRAQAIDSADGRSHFICKPIGKRQSVIGFENNPTLLS
jgi:hypothetical protein